VKIAKKEKERKGIILHPQKLKFYKLACKRIRKPVSV
jgi:hypothetical protein